VVDHGLVFHQRLRPQHRVGVGTLAEKQSIRAMVNILGIITRH
jgi:hypothetical protein